MPPNKFGGGCHWGNVYASIVANVISAFHHRTTGEIHIVADGPARMSSRLLYLILVEYDPHLIVPGSFT
jgi:hypothetical protein